MIQTNRIDHINATVTNLKVSTEFYKRIFSLKTFEKGVSHGSPYEILGDPNSFFLCLYQGKKRENGPVNHFGIHIHNFNQGIQELEKNGVEILYGGVVNYPKSRSAYIKDPDGNEIELSEAFGGGF